MMAWKLAWRRKFPCFPNHWQRNQPAERSQLWPLEHGLPASAEFYRILDHATAAFHSCQELRAIGDRGCVTVRL